MARTAAELQAILAKWYAAEEALAAAQSYTMDTGQGRVTVTRADLPSIARRIADLEAQLEGRDADDSLGFERESV